MAVKQFPELLGRYASILEFGKPISGLKVKKNYISEVIFDFECTSASYYIKNDSGYIKFMVITLEEESPDSAGECIYRQTMSFIGMTGAAVSANLLDRSQAYDQYKTIKRMNIKYGSRFKN